MLWVEGCAQLSGVGLAPKQQLSYLSRAPVSLLVNWEPIFTPCPPVWDAAASSELMSESVVPAQQESPLVKHLCPRVRKLSILFKNGNRHS